MGVYCISVYFDEKIRPNRGRIFLWQKLIIELSICDNSKGQKMIKRINITLDQQEYSAILKLTESELRNPSDQIRHIVRNKLVSLGLIEIEALHPKLKGEILNGK